MALPLGGQDNGTFSQPVVSGKKNKALRVAAIGSAVILACATLVALIGQASEAPHTNVELVAFSSRSDNAHIAALAREFLQHGAKMSQVEAIQKIRNWNDDEHVAKLMASPARTQMLAGVGPAVDHVFRTQSLEGESMLCEKRQKIIELFDQLLKKLGGMELSMNITMGNVLKEWEEAMKSWLEIESNYRMTVEKVKDAREGSKFAEMEYEKWKTAHKQAKKELEAMKARYDDERKDLMDEREVIKQIMRYIGVLHDVKATEKSIAAGGKDSVIDAESGVSDPYAIKKAIGSDSTAELNAKISQLHKLVLKTKLPGYTQKLAQIEQLPVYSETEEVVRILKEILDDIKTRLSVIDDVLAQAQKMVDDAYTKMVDWEKKLVVLAAEADKAKEKMLRDKLDREKAAGTYEVTVQTKDTQEGAYKITITPWEREIYVITMIKIKINEHCDKLARGEASEFGK